MKLTDGLLGEHALFYDLFDRVEGIVDEAKSLDAVVAAVRVLAAAVTGHAEIEERLFFPNLPVGPVALMLDEHRQIRRLIDGIPAVQELEIARNGAYSLLGILRDHFHREEHLIFPTSEAEIGEQKLLELGARWAEWRGLG